MKTITGAYEVRPFGNDCLGNITGYVVARGYGLSRETAGQFVGNIYEAGSFDMAKVEANALRDKLNAEAR